MIEIPPKENREAVTVRLKAHVKRWLNQHKGQQGRLIDEALIKQYKIKENGK